MAMYSLTNSYEGECGEEDCRRISIFYVQFCNVFKGMFIVITTTRMKYNEQRQNIAIVEDNRSVSVSLNNVVTIPVTIYTVISTRKKR